MVPLRHHARAARPAPTPPARPARLCSRAPAGTQCCSQGLGAARRLKAPPYPPACSTSLALTNELRRLGVLNPPWLPGGSLPRGSVKELPWIQVGGRGGTHPGRPACTPSIQIPSLPALPGPSRCCMRQECCRDQLRRAPPNPLAWPQLMVEAAGSKAPNKTVQGLLDSAYALSRRDYFAEKSWFVGKPLPRKAFAAIFSAVDAAGASVTLDAIALRVSHPANGLRARVAGPASRH